MAQFPTHVIADTKTGYLKRNLYFNERAHVFLGKSVYLTSDSKAEIKKVLKMDQELSDRLNDGHNFAVMTFQEQRRIESEQPEKIEEERPCPDDEDYECYSCGGPTGRGYDSGQCCMCLGE